MIKPPLASKSILNQMPKATPRTNSQEHTPLTKYKTPSKSCKSRKS